MSDVVTIFAVRGAQQSAIAHRFERAGWRVRGASRTDGATPFGPALVADPETGAGVAAALDGARVAVLTLPQDHRDGAMTRVARTIARIADEVGLDRLLLNVGATVAERNDSPLMIELRAARDAVTDGRAPFVVLEPTVYMDNLLAPWSLDAIRGGAIVYAAPEAAAISWISHATLADFALAAATRADAVGRMFRIGGPRAHVGADLAATLERRLGRPIRYVRADLAAFAAGIDQWLGAPAGERIASIYAMLDSEPRAMAVDGSAAAALGVAPESFDMFAARHDWTA